MGPARAGAMGALWLVAGAAASAAAPVPAHLSGRVYERGSIAPLAGVELLSSTGARAVTDEAGRFELDLPAGEVELLLRSPRHEPMRRRLRLVAGDRFRVVYRLLPRPGRYESIVHGEQRREGERHSLSGRELHEAPGAMSDPLRAIGLLPGVATPIPLLPAYVIRGGSPGGNGFYLDGMRIPQLFHFLVGGGVVHGRLIERLDFYPGAYDASFGRQVGAVIDAETRPARADAPHGELELRLYDVSLLAEAPLPGGVRVEVGGHFGWPSYLVHAAEPRVQELQYWDYQLRADWRGLTLEALGSFDVLAFGNLLSSDPERIRLMFHRVQLRDRTRFGRVEVEAAIVGGEDEMLALGGLGVRKLSLGARASVRATWARFKLSAGADGEVSRFTGEAFGKLGSDPDFLGELAGDRDGLVVGTFAQGALEIVPRRLTATVGVRGDLYRANGVTLVGVDPRAVVRLRALPGLAMTAGFGLYQQPPSFPVALPGIDTFALSIGLQRAWQGAASIEATLPGEVELNATGYYQRMIGLTDVAAPTTAPLSCAPPPPRPLSGAPAQLVRQVDGASFGLELMVRRRVGPITGWIAYTLSRSERNYPCGLRPADADQTHLLNAVVQLQLPWRVMAGARLYLATGRPATLVDLEDPLGTLRNNTRLPTFGELDLRLDREWIFDRWAISAFVEVLNVTNSKTVYQLTYPLVNGKRSLNPVEEGFRWVLPSVGVRGRF